MPMMFINIFARDINFRTLTINDGLPETTANVIFKDNLGFMWFGMHNGLCRFDGIKIKTYPDFISETIRTICQTDSTHLWVGTLSGLKVIDLEKGDVRTILSPNNRTLPEVYSLLHHNGQLYICTAAGLYMYSQNEIKHVQVSQNTLSGENVIMNICFDSDENCWVMTLGGLFRYDTSQNEFTRFSESIPSSVPINYASMAFFGNKLYISIETIGLWVFNLHTKKMESPIPLKDKNIRSISCQDSMLYVATGSGLKLISLQDYRIIKTIKPDENRLNGLRSSTVYSFFKDEEFLWLGIYAGGISYTYLKESNFEIYSCLDVKFTTVNRNVRSSCVDKYGNRLIGTRDGLYYIQQNKKKLHLFTTQNTQKLLSNTILFLYPFNNEVIVGTYSGLYLFNPDNLSFSFFREDNIFKDEAFYAIDHDKSNNLWFGVSGGVIWYNYETHKLKRYTSENSNVFNSDIHTIECDTKDRVWAAGINGVCLISQSNGKVIDQILPPEFDSKLQTIRCVFEDSHGRIWICTSKDGLFRLNESLTNIDYFTDQDLLPSNVLYNILEDKEGYLWIATLKGILMYNDETGEKRIFDSSDGLPDYTFNLYNHIDNNGIIWWGSENGLIYCNPLNVRNSHKQDTNIVITSIVIAGKEILLIEDNNTKRKVTPEYVNSIHLSSFENNITFYLSQLSFSTSKGSYEYKLDAYDKSWHKIIDNNEISYRDLPSGTYNLIIRKLGGKSEKTIRIVVGRSISTIVYGGIGVLLLAIVIFLTGKYLNSRRYKNKPDHSNFDSNEEHRKKYSSSKIQQTQLVQIREQLLAYMDKEKPYMNPQLKLSDIATTISCSPTYLSQCLNQELNTNFTDFINSYRIELFKQKIKYEKVSQYTLFALAQSCGFSSRTSFFRLFKKQTGFSPLEYIKKKGLSLSEDDIE
jgi:ligand-binding sensor domain-containing protein/AraC-like DNA-binding protein